MVYDRIDYKNGVIEYVFGQVFSKFGVGYCRLLCRLYNDYCVGDNKAVAVKWVSLLDCCGCRVFCDCNGGCVLLYSKAAQDVVVMLATSRCHLLSVVDFSSGVIELIVIELTNTSKNKASLPVCWYANS